MTSQKKKRIFLKVWLDVIHVSLCIFLRDSREVLTCFQLSGDVALLCPWTQACAKTGLWGGLDFMASMYISIQNSVPALRLPIHMAPALQSWWCSVSSTACLLPLSPTLLVTRPPSPESRLFSLSSDQALVMSPWIILFIGLPASSPNLSPSPLSILLSKCLLLKCKSDHGLPLF